MPLTDEEVHRLLTAPGCGGPFELTRVNVRGYDVNAWKHANTSMRQLWLESAANADKPYLTFIDNSEPLSGADDPRITKALTLTYREAHERSAALAWTLLNEFGVQRGDRVAIAGRNCIEWILSFWTVVSLGCVVVPINAWLPAEGQEYCLQFAEPKVIVADGERLSKMLKQGTFNRLREKHGLRHIVTMFHEGFVKDLDSRNELSWRQLQSWPGLSTFETAVALGMNLAKKHGFPPPAGPGQSAVDMESMTIVNKPSTTNSMDLDPDEPATLFFSSGTSGFPKGCVGTHRSYCQTPLTALYRSVHAAVKKAGGLHGMPPMPKVEDPARAQLLTTPLFHITATKSRLGGSTFTGGTVAFLYKWQPLDCLYVCSALRISSIGGVPTMFYGILDEVEKSKKGGKELDLSCVTSFSYGGAPCPAALVDKLREVFPGVAIGQGYGLTESSNNVSIAGDDYLSHPGSVGKLNPVSQMKIVEVTDWDRVSADHKDKEVPVGQVGELCFRGANVIAGYYRDPAATRRSFRGGWVHTGDVGFIDKDGFVYLVDRSKEMIIRGGENIYTVTIEEALYKAPGVWDAGAIGIPDPGISLGELPVGAVVVKPGSKVPTSEELREFCRKMLPGFAVPVYVDVRVGEGPDATLERNVNGKLVKKQLREAIIKRMEKEGVIEKLKGAGASKGKL